MVDPKPQRNVDSIVMRRLNEEVASSKPFAYPKSVPTKQAEPRSPSLPAQTPSAATAPIAAPIRRRHSKRFYVLTSLAGVLLTSGAALAFYVHGQLHNKFSAASIVVSVAKASSKPPVQLQGEADGRTNFLIYGMTKDGMRTDSIMLASYYYKQKKLVTLNIPRDLYVNDGYENAKFGEVYAYAKMRQPHNSQYPDQFVSNLVSKEYSLPIHYWVELNMQGEVQLVNSIGGVDVNVPDAFTDYEYPTWSYSGYIRPAPHFAAGPQHMNGDQALIYSRSRHSLDNNEGSDFARSKRQGLVMQAAITKIKSQGVLGNIPQLATYLSIVSQNVSTNMSTDEMVASAGIMKGVNPNTDHLIANWSTSNGFLCDSTSPIGAYITLYGTIGNCTTKAGGPGDSKYRERAITYVQDLLQTVLPSTASAAAGTTSQSTASGGSVQQGRFTP